MTPSAALAILWCFASAASGRGFEVIGAGLRHAGSYEFHEALKILGFKPYNAREDLSNTHEVWKRIERTSRPQGGNNPTELFKFSDGLVNEGYNAIVGSPAAFHVQRLIQKYPNAKVVLTRHADHVKWYRALQTSTQKAVHRDVVDSEYNMLTTLAGRIVPPADEDKDNFVAAYEKHMDIVRAAVPPGQLFEIKPGQELTWGPLCKFLGVPVPSAPIPELVPGNTNPTSNVVVWGAAFGALLLVLLVAAVVLSPSQGPDVEGKRCAGNRHGRKAKKIT